MPHKIKSWLTSIVIIAGLAVVGRAVLTIVTAARDGQAAIDAITIPKTDTAAVSQIREREPIEQSIDFSDDFVGGRADPFSGFSGAVPASEPATENATESATETSAAEPTGTPTDNPQAATGNEYASDDAAPEISLDQL